VIVLLLSCLRLRFWFHLFFQASERKQFGCSISVEGADEPIPLLGGRSRRSGGTLRTGVRSPALCHNELKQLLPDYQVSITTMT